jgi:hypothetical protein
VRHVVQLCQNFSQLGEFLNKSQLVSSSSSSSSSSLLHGIGNQACSSFRNTRVEGKAKKDENRNNNKKK